VTWYLSNVAPAQRGTKTAWSLRRVWPAPCGTWMLQYLYDVVLAHRDSTINMCYTNLVACKNMTVF